MGVPLPGKTEILAPIRTAPAPALGLFGVDRAKEAADAVFDHDPVNPFLHALEPASEDAAAAAVRQLGKRFEMLPAPIRYALQGAESNAGNLSDDRLQGLAELIQNADDVHATTVRFSVETGPDGSTIACSHDGTQLRLRDVMGLATPWLSLKSSDSASLGRFGIGLMTLRSLSDSLEVHCGYFHVSLQAQKLTALKGDGTSSRIPTAGSTLFRIPVRGGGISESDIVDWLRNWGDAGLIFLANVRRVEVLHQNGAVSSCAQVEKSEPYRLPSDMGTTTRSDVTAQDLRQWSVYTRHVISPASARRSLKAQAATTPVSIAFPSGHTDQGHIHVGLPVRSIGLPFRVSAQFDPLANRRDIADSEWNIALVSEVSRLWLDASLDLFERRPADGWATVPLRADLDADSRTVGRLREELDAELLGDARRQLSLRLTFSVGEAQPLHLDELAVEHRELTNVLDPLDVAKLAGCSATLPETARDQGNGWRGVLKDLAQAGSKTPLEVTVSDALPLLEEPTRSEAFISALTSVAITGGLGREVLNLPCLSFNDGSRRTPNSIRGTLAIVDETAAPLWRTLGMGVLLHSEYVANSGWPIVEAWLKEGQRLLANATSDDALSRLAAAGQSHQELPGPLNDVQAEALRAALEHAAESDRAVWGPGIGRAVRFDAIEYGERGQRIRVHGRPCDAYIIEREAGTWHTAAERTPGLLWLDRRYASALRADTGRTGIGSQRLFRLLGAETAPRLKPHTNLHKRYAGEKPGVSRDIPGLPERRERMRQKGATYTLEDFVSPDLDTVLQNIALDKNASNRRRRANAALSTIAKAWERLEPYAMVTAVQDYYTWQNVGEISACWIFSAASIRWLSDGKATPKSPAELGVRSPGNLALRGPDPSNYLHPSHDTSAWHRVLEALGVRGDPLASELMRALSQVRDEFQYDPAAAADSAAPLYQALAQQIPSTGSYKTLGDLSRSEVRTLFGQGQGLISTSQGWRRPSTVLSGPPIFGDFRNFVPAVAGANVLWRLVGIQSPTPEDARAVLRELAKEPTLDPSRRLIMLESLRLMNGRSGSAEKSTNLRKMPVWTNNGWKTTRPVFAVMDRQLSEALESVASVWKPGGEMRQFNTLIEPLALNAVVASDVVVSGHEGAEINAAGTEIFRRAVRILQSDLSLNDSEAERALKISWNDLVGFEVVDLPGLSVAFEKPHLLHAATVRVGAWIDTSWQTFYVETPTQTGRASTGGMAVASLFDVDARRIAHAWMAAWAAAAEGHHAEEITLASRRAADEAARRAAEGEIRLHALRLQAQAKRITERESALRNGASKDAKTKSALTKSMIPRTLVDPSALTITNPSGTLSGRQQQTQSEVSLPVDSPPAKLQAPNIGRSKTTVLGRGPVNFTPEERESVGLELVRQVLGGQAAGIVDIRSQHNVGADATDDLARFFELKVHQGPIPNTIRLTDSEVQRALTTKDFFLVLVGNVERGGDHPEVRILTDPLDQLSVEPSGSIQLSDVHGAQALTYHFGASDPADQ
jgi:hypothetical protein